MNVNIIYFAHFSYSGHCTCLLLWYCYQFPNCHCITCMWVWRRVSIQLYRVPFVLKPPRTEPEPRDIFLIENGYYFSWTRSVTPYTYVQGYIRHCLMFELLLDFCNNSVTLSWLDSLSIFFFFSYLRSDMPLVIFTFSAPIWRM